MMMMMMVVVVVVRVTLNAANSDSTRFELEFCRGQPDVTPPQLCCYANSTR